MNINYKTYTEFPGWDEAPEYLENCVRHELAQAPSKRFRILEVGSGANPTLSPDQVRELNIAYTSNDCNAGELAKADPIYDSLEWDLCSTQLPEASAGSYDLIFSRMVNEHVRNGKQYYENLLHLLKPGGLTVHCYSTLYALPFVINRLVPETVADRLLSVFNPRDRYQHDKFRAYYSWSRGPSEKSVKRFEDLGFEIEEYVGYFGHNYYDKRLPWLGRFERAKARFLRDHAPSPLLTSYATIALRKPLEKASLYQDAQ